MTATALETFIGTDAGWRSFATGDVIGSSPDNPPDLTGYTVIGSPGSNPRTTIQNALDNHGKVALAPVSDGGAADWDCTSSVLVESDYELYVGDGVHLWRNFNSSNATSSAFIKNRSFAASADDVKIWGPGDIAARNNMGGNIFSLISNRLWLSGFTMSYFKRGLMLAGDDQVMEDVVGRVAPGADSGGAGVRFAGGDSFLGQRLNFISGDDVFQFVPAGATNDPMWNYADITNGNYVDCVGRSYSARVCVVGLQDSNGGGSVALGMNTSILNCKFTRVHGFGGGTAVNVANHSSTGKIQHIYFDDVLCDQRMTKSPTQGQPGETFVQVEATASTPTMGIVDDIDFGGTTGHGTGVTIYNKRSGKDLTHITDPQGKVSNVTTAKTHAGNLDLVL